MKIVFLWSVLWFCTNFKVACFGVDPHLVANITVKLLQTKEVIIFACNRSGILEVTQELHNHNQRVQYVNLNTKLKLYEILTRNNFARTAVIVDCSCNTSYALLIDASDGRYINKTYQWLLFDHLNIGIEVLIPTTLSYFGPNAQVTYINESNTNFYFWDIHSKGFHLGCKLEKILIAEASFKNGRASDFKIYVDLYKVQGIKYRDQFAKATLRGATVIDRDNITTNEQIEEILGHPTKDYGVAPFSKYHYELLKILQHGLNFSVNFRNARGWASRLGSTTFRLGFLGIIMRNEADIGASAAFNRLNRFAEFDTIHQSWKFETAFVYRFTADLSTHNKNGNFLAAFDFQVWCIALATLMAFNFTWRFVEFICAYCQRKIQREFIMFDEPALAKSISSAKKRRKRRTVSIPAPIQTKPQKNILENCCNRDSKDNTISAISLNTFAAVCQQGLDPIPQGFSTRTIVITLYFFSLVMYNYYTSSVVGGLLSSTAQGPATVDEIVASPLKLSFEDIGYYKVLFRENTSPLVKRLLQRKLLPPRSAGELPVYTHIEDAIPYIKTGGVAFHCEVVDAYPELAKDFDSGEICDLRVVSGLMETDNMNWVVSKNSQYTELFRTVMCRTREVGLVQRLLKQRRPRQPECQSLYTVYPVSITGVLSAFFLLIGGIILALQILCVEIICNNLLKSERAKLCGKH